MSAESIIQRYNSWHPDRGIDELLELRQRLSIECVRVANEVKKAEHKHKTFYMERKIAEAETFLKEDGTVGSREAKSIEANSALRIQEAKQDGIARGGKILLDSYYKVLDSMASYIKTMQTL